MTAFQPGDVVRLTGDAWGRYIPYLAGTEQTIEGISDGPNPGPYFTDGARRTRVDGFWSAELVAPATLSPQAILARHPEPAVSDERYGVEAGWLVEYVGEHTCGTGPDGHYGAHEPGCGTVPIVQIEQIVGPQPQVQAPVGEGLEECKSGPATLQAGIANASDSEREFLIDFLNAADPTPTSALADDLLAAGFRRSPVVDVEDVARVLHQALGIENEYAPTPDDRVESCYPSFYDCVGQHARDESFVPGDAMCFHTATAILAHLLEGGA